SDDVSTVRPLLAQALTVLAKTPTPDAGALLLKARIHARLQEVELACNAYREALAQVPRRSDWRWELSQFLVETGRLREARAELAMILTWNPQDENARTLHASVVRRLIEVP